MDRGTQEAIGAVETQLKRVAYSLEVLIRMQIGQSGDCRMCVVCGCTILAPMIVACPVCGTTSKGKNDDGSEVG